jgi:hypothetical protein
VQRLFTKDSTGISPNGRWFAGDINAIQDAVAGLTDFAQTVSMSVLRLGDSTIQLLKYGSAEARLTSALRTDGIVRALGGLYAGAFTTSQRNAIPLGSRPYGLVILNSTTNRYEWNSGSDATPVWLAFGAGNGVGNLGAIPDPAATVAGSRYFASDQVVDYVCDGTRWIRVGTPAGATVSWYKPDNTAPPGWVKYDSSVLPASTGIYADLYAHLGTTTTPDTRGRGEVGIGAHSDVDTIGKNEGEVVANRRPKHKHTVPAGFSFDSGWVTVPNDARSFVKVSDRLTYYASVNGQFDVTSMMRWTS